MRASDFMWFDCAHNLAGETHISVGLA
jgi:hypothetical protein